MLDYKLKVSCFFGMILNYFFKIKTKKDFKFLKPSFSNSYVKTHLVKCKAVRAEAFLLFSFPSQRSFVPLAGTVWPFKIR